MNVLYHASQVKTYINMSYMQERQQKSDFFFWKVNIKYLLTGVWEDEPRRCISIQEI